MHLLIPFASSDAPQAVTAFKSLNLQHLKKLLSGMTLTHNDAGQATDLSPPHERALAAHLGLRAADGCIPWAAWEQACQPGRQAIEGTAFAFITPCQWQSLGDHFGMSDPARLNLTESESRALMQSVRPYFDEDGISLEYQQPLQWLARSNIFLDLPTASIDRVLGDTVDAWLPRSPQAAPLRRLQNEMQMLFYTHPVNDARTARGEPSINSFWISGTGALAKATDAAPSVDTTLALTYADQLRLPALQHDWQAWAQAWHTLDTTACAALLRTIQAGQPARLTLCGDRGALSFENLKISLFKKIYNVFGTKPFTTLDSML